MEKLIELLKQFDIKRGRQYPEYKIEKGIIYYVYHNPLEGDEYTDCTLNIISKKFGFIKRLIDNNKIDYHNVLRTGYEFEDGVFYHYDDYYCLLMLLSISDNPISDLITYLK